MRIFILFWPKEGFPLNAPLVIINISFCFILTLNNFDEINKGMNETQPSKPSTYAVRFTDTNTTVLKCGFKIVAKWKNPSKRGLRSKRWDNSYNSINFKTNPYTQKKTASYGVTVMSQFGNSVWHCDRYTLRMNKQLLFVILGKQACKLFCLLLLFLVSVIGTGSVSDLQEITK